MPPLMAASMATANSVFCWVESIQTSRRMASGHEAAENQERPTPDLECQDNIPHNGCHSQGRQDRKGVYSHTQHPLKPLATTAVNQLHQSGCRYALCTMCIGVGQGIA